jgi:hypothetical protein
MHEGIEQNSVTFHNRARSEFFPLYQEFRQSVKLLDRQRDENVYQQLQMRFANQLQHRLQNIAMELLLHTEHTCRNQLNPLLANAIDGYVQEFMQKARSL